MNIKVVGIDIAKNVFQIYIFLSKSVRVQF